jgi:hypothetical protein
MYLLQVRGARLCLRLRARPRLPRQHRGRFLRPPLDERPDRQERGRHAANDAAHDRPDVGSAAAARGRMHGALSVSAAAAASVEGRHRDAVRRERERGLGERRLGERRLGERRLGERRLRERRAADGHGARRCPAARRDVGESLGGERLRGGGIEALACGDRERGPLRDGDEAGLEGGGVGAVRDDVQGTRSSPLGPAGDWPRLVVSRTEPRRPAGYIRVIGVALAETTGGKERVRDAATRAVACQVEPIRARGRVAVVYDTECWNISF